MSLLSPEVDLLIEHARYHRGSDSTSPEIMERVRAYHALLGRIEPVKSGRDSIWSLWITTERGRLEDFGDYEEYREAGDVDSREEFEELWRFEYPDEVQWRRVRIIQYEQRLFFRVGELEFDVDLESGKFSGIDLADGDCRKLALWLLDAIAGEVQRFLSDPQVYNREIERRLPLSMRFGRIRRRSVWEAATEINRLDEELGSENLERFRRIVREMDDEVSVAEMTLADYLSFCAVCYGANDYPHLESSMTPREMYRAMADNRDAGLLEILPNDPESFSRWYRERQPGAHPWEICRGGNRTHISLSVTQRNDGWQLRLAGFSSVRAVETARMAIALSERAVPFVLEQRHEMLRMLTGEDFLGIVPADIPLGYNHGSFPKDGQIYSFVHLNMIEDACGSLPEGVVWYPLENLSPETAPTVRSLRGALRGAGIDESDCRPAE